ncbi:hypothetical protein [Methylorubrum aminovorans]
MEGSAMPETASHTISRRLATGAVVVAGEVTASDLALWLAGLTRIAATSPGVARGTSPVDAYMRAEMVAADVPVRDLTGLVGAPRLALLRPMVARLQDTRVRLMGLSDAEAQACLGWETVGRQALAPGEPERTCILPREPERADETAALWFPGKLAAEAHVTNDTEAQKPVPPVAFDLAAVGRMRSRYSPLLYLRALAWLSGPVPLRSGWGKRFVAKGRCEIRVPLPDAGLLIGVDALRRKADIERLALGPAKADLAAAGINLHVEWIRLAGYAQVFTHLALTVSLSARKPGAAAPAPKLRKVRLRPRTPAAPAIREDELPY